MQRRLRRADRDALPVRKDGGLDGGAMRDRLLRGDGAVGLLAPKVVAKKRPDLPEAAGGRGEVRSQAIPEGNAVPTLAGNGVSKGRRNEQSALLPSTEMSLGRSAGPLPSLRREQGEGTGGLPGKAGKALPATFAMRVDPPTRTSSSMCPGCKPTRESTCGGERREWAAARSSSALARTREGRRELRMWE